MTRKTNLNGNNQQGNSADNSSEIIKSIKEKLDKSPALNGEFDTLLHKVDKIEECNGNLNKNKLSIIIKAAEQMFSGFF